MKYLIVGGAGFIGTNLAERLLSEGHQVTILDNLITGRSENILYLNRKFPKHPPKFLFQDIAKDYSDLPYNFINEDLLENEKFNVIYHLASPASPPKYIKFPFETMDANIKGTRNCCRLALTMGAQLIFASTSEVYGCIPDDKLPVAESYFGNVNSYGPRSCYDESKRLAETIIFEYQKLGLKAKIIRIFNTYGPHMDLTDGRVISNFISAALQKKDLELYTLIEKEHFNNLFLAKIVSESLTNYAYKTVLTENGHKEKDLNFLQKIKQKLFSSKKDQTFQTDSIKSNTDYIISNKTRSFCYITDLIDGFRLIEKSNITTPINLGNDQEIDLLTLAIKVLTLTKSPSAINFKTSMQDDPGRRQPDLSLVKTLGYKPKVSLKKGLIKTIEYFNKEMEKNK